jgi:hypothetical protein
LIVFKQSVGLVSGSILTNAYLEVEDEAKQVLVTRSPHTVNTFIQEDVLFGSETVPVNALNGVGVERLSTGNWRIVTEC